MANYKVLKEYHDKELGKTLAKGEQVEMTVKRAEEVEKTLEAHGGPFLERLKK